MNQETKLAKFNHAKHKLQDAIELIHDAGVLHDDATSISTERFNKLRSIVGEFVTLIEACEHSTRMEKPVEEATSQID